MSKRDEWVEKFKTKIDDVNTEIDRLKGKAENASGDAKQQYQKYLQELHEQRDNAQKRLNELREASEAAFENLRQGAENAWNSLRNALASARDKF